MASNLYGFICSFVLFVAAQAELCSYGGQYCVGDEYCCGSSCCTYSYYNDYIYTRWWFWMIWVVVIVVISVILGCCRYRRTRGVIIRQAVPPSTTVTIGGAPGFQYGQFFNPPAHTGPPPQYAV